MGPTLGFNPLVMTGLIFETGECFEGQERTPLCLTSFDKVGIDREFNPRCRDYFLDAGDFLRRIFLLSSASFSDSRTL